MSKLELKNIKIETDEKVVVDNVSFVVKSGEIHIIMGPNGSGKSSLVNGIFGHPKYKITNGDIVLDGENITNKKTQDKARRGLFLSMQYLPEIEGVTLTKFLHKAYNAIKRLQTPVLEFHKYLTTKAESVGISTDFLGKHLNTRLSGGEKKQSEILQLLALEPKFAFLDEIDSGVDVDSLNKVFKGIELLKKEGTGFVLITHYTKILSKLTPDKVHIMKDGKVIKSGGHELVEEIEENGFGDQ